MSSQLQINGKNLAPVLAGLKIYCKPADKRVNALSTAISNTTYVNQNEVLSLCSCINEFVPKPKGNALSTIEKISIYYELPFAQFIIDIYTEIAIQNNLTINQFMSKSKCLSNIPKDNTSWILLRQYLSNYFKCIYSPFNKDNFSINYEDNKDNDDIDDDFDYDILPSLHTINPVHNMHKVLKYITKIHQTVISSQIQQIDVIFTSNILNNINKRYFEKENMKYAYQQMSYNKTDDEVNILQLFRDFTINCNKKSRLFKRSVILIMADNSNNLDDVYMFKPLYNNSLPRTICEYSELPWISNSISVSKTLPLLDNIDDVFNVSFHIHSNSEQRVYFLYKSYGIRLFKRNIIDVLSLFCYNKITKTKWMTLCTKGFYYGTEFKDDRYLQFKNDLFPDFMDISFNDLNEIENWCNENEFDNIDQLTADIENPQQSFLVESFPNIFPIPMPFGLK